jgi:hypothetical protein
VGTYVRELREFLGLFGLLPERPAGWVNQLWHMQLTDPVHRSDRISRDAAGSQTKKSRK